MLEALGRGQYKKRKEMTLLYLGDDPKDVSKNVRTIEKSAKDRFTLKNFRGRQDFSMENGEKVIHFK